MRPEAVSSETIDSTPRTSASTRYLTLDHWRGLACLIIVIHHALLPMCDYGVPARPATSSTTMATSAAGNTIVSGRQVLQAPRNALRNWLVDRMHVGVQIFFVISGYCIAATTSSLALQRRPVRRYFERRFLRIFPAYWCALLGSVVLCLSVEWVAPGLIKRVPWALSLPADLSVAQWIGSITLSETWLSYLTGEIQNCFPIQIWTLCYELQFYVVVGLLFSCTRRHLFPAVALLTLAVGLFDALALYHQVRIRGLWMDEHWFMFAVGIGLYWDLNRASSKQAMVFRSVIILGMVGLAMAASLTTTFGQRSQFSAWRIIEALSFAAVLLCLKRYDQQIARISKLNWLRSCGIMCYSIYLTHLFPGKVLSQQLIEAGFSDDLSIVVICVPLTLAMAISLGYIFHVLVEARFFHDSTHSLRVAVAGALPVVQRQSALTAAIALRSQSRSDAAAMLPAVPDTEMPSRVA